MINAAFFTLFAANEKSSLPKLNSKVHDLKGIARHGAYDKRLQDEKIYDVQGFLKALNKDPDKLRRVNINSTAMLGEFYVRNIAYVCLQKSFHKSLTCHMFSE